MLLTFKLFDARKGNKYLLGLQDHDSDLVTLGGINEALVITMSGLVGNPARLLGIIRLGLQLGLQLGGDLQPRGWIWIGSITLLDVAGHLET